MFESIKLRKARTKYELEQYKLALKQLEEASSLIRDPDEDDWIQLGGSSKGISESDISTMHERAYEFWLNNPHAFGIIRILEKFILGKGVTVDALDENEMVQECWNEFVIENNFSLKQDEIVRRVFRDGEIFIRYYVDRLTGKVQIRFIDPIQIKDPTNTHSFGIETEPEDIETPIKYYRSKGNIRKEIIPAEEIQHIKIFADSNVKRGISFLYTIIPWIKKHEDWLNDLTILTKVRTAVAIIKTVSDPTQVQKIADAQRSSKQSSISQRTKMLKAGTVITAGEGVKYEFLEPKIQAGDLQHVGRNLLLALVTCTGLAEYMVTGDAQHANYASTMVAESPAVREFEKWQEFFKLVFQIMFRKVIQAGIDYGPIPEISEKTTTYYTKEGESKDIQKVPTNINCDIQFPPLIARNIKDEADVLALAENRGWISSETAAAKLGFNYEEEQEKIKREELEYQEDMKYEKNRNKAIEKEPEEIPEPE